MSKQPLPSGKTVRYSLLPSIFAVGLVAVVSGVGGYAIGNIATPRQSVQEVVVSRPLIQSSPEIPVDSEFGEIVLADPRPVESIMPEPELTLVPSPSPSPVPSISPVAITGWKTFRSAVVNVAFKYPPESEYQGNQKDKVITYTDAKKQSPGFDIVLEDGDDDFLTGSFDTPDAWTIREFMAQYTQVKELAAGIYQVSGYSENNCAPITKSYLIVKAPPKSNTKYIRFDLGKGTAPSTSLGEYDVCVVQPDEIDRAVSELAENRVPEVKANLEKALAIAESFGVK